MKVTKDSVKKLERMELINLYCELKECKLRYENGISIVVDELRSRRVRNITHHYGTAEQGMLSWYVYSVQYKLNSLGGESMAYPKPTVEEPTMDELEDMVFDVEMPTATDGCIIDPDGICQHGYPSWLLYLGLI